MTSYTLRSRYFSQASSVHRVVLRDDMLIAEGVAEVPKLQASNHEQVVDRSCNSCRRETDIRVKSTLSESSKEHLLHLWCIAPLSEHKNVIGPILTRGCSDKGHLVRKGFASLNLLVVIVETFRRMWLILLSCNVVSRRLHHRVNRQAKFMNYERKVDNRTSGEARNLICQNPSYNGALILGSLRQ